MRLVVHNIRLAERKISLRPMTEADWDNLYEWNNDPEILYFADSEAIESMTMERVQEMYRSVSLNAYCFIIEYNGKPTGECWIQKMNLRRILVQFPGRDCRRIDIVIGKKELWNRGIGTGSIGLLTKFGFEVENADLIFGCDIAEDNPRSLRAFLKNGYSVLAKNRQPKGEKTNYRFDLAIRKEDYVSRH